MSQIVLIILGLTLLIFLSAFFSISETGLMAINRYRLRHRARMGKKSAVLILKLLKRPDRVLGLILIGNTFANIVASALATVLAIHFFGEKGVVFSTVLLTLIILIWCEVAPKTLAALYPERVSKMVAWPVTILLKVFYPLVWLINFIANNFLRLLGVKVGNRGAEPLSREELRSVVYETAGRVSHQYQNMLLGILDLNKVIVDDVMIPHHEITGIDLEQDWDVIKKQLAASEHDWLPVYRESINQVVGFLHLRDLMKSVAMNEVVDKESLTKILQETYFIPEGTPLNIQLLNFQRLRRRIALVVDEYGEVLGLVSLEDILEEIVGEFTTSVSAANKMAQPQPDGSYLVDGAITVRELNRITQWNFPTRGPRTLNGLIIEYLEAMPLAGTCVRIADYPIEIVHVKENRVKVARIFPRLLEEELGSIE